METIVISMKERTVIHLSNWDMKSTFST